MSQRKKRAGIAVAAAAVWMAAAPWAARAADEDAAKPLAVGDQAPAIALTASDGTEHELGRAPGDGATVIIFNRGVW